MIIDTYANIRPQIRSFDVLACIGDSFVSRQIRRFEHQVYKEIPFSDLLSHVGLVLVPPGMPRVLVYESVESKGVHLWPLSGYTSNWYGTGRRYNGRIFILRNLEIEREWEELSSDSRVDWLAASIDTLGLPYDRDQIMKLAFRISFGLKKKDSDNEYICSELVDERLRALGIETQKAFAEICMPADFTRDPKWVTKFEIVE